MRKWFWALLSSTLLFASGCEGELSVLNEGQQAQPGTSPGVSGPGMNGPGIGEPGNPTQASFIPGRPLMRRLTTTEYLNTVEDAFGLGFVVNFALPEDNTTHGLTSIAMSNIAVSNLGVEQYESTSYRIARVLTDIPSLRDSLLNCDRATERDATCYARFVETYGKRLWRRDLTRDEVATYRDAAVMASAALGDFWHGLEFALAGLLQSPNMIYRTEYGVPDTENPGLRKLTGIEIASKLSYLLWGSAPSVALIDLATQGGLDTPEQVRDQAAQMLTADRAREAFNHFWNEYFELQYLETLTKDPATYPLFSPDVAQSMRYETLRLMEHLVFDEKADMREMFTTRTTFVNIHLTQIYGIRPPAGTTFNNFVQTELPLDAKRAGVLGHASFLSKNSHPVDTSPTHRGLSIRQSMMCMAIPAPPPDVSTIVPEPDPNAGPQTLRQRLEDYFDNPSCGTCHAAMDYLGFGLEHYDAIGAWRDEDNGLPIDASGTLNDIDYDNAVSMGIAIAEDPATMDCMVRKTYRHVVGRLEGREDQPLIQELSAAFTDSGYRFQDLLLDIVSSDAFFYVQEVAE